MSNEEISSLLWKGYPFTSDDEDLQEREKHDVLKALIEWTTASGDYPHKKGDPPATQLRVMEAHVHDKMLATWKEKVQKKIAAKKKGEEKKTREANEALANQSRQHAMHRDDHYSELLRKNMANNKWLDDFKANPEREVARLQELFVQSAKEKALAPWHAMVLTSTLMAADKNGNVPVERVMHMCHNILTQSTDPRIFSAHNYFQVGIVDKEFHDPLAVSNALTSLAFPLFPHAKCPLINKTLLESAEPLTGSGVSVGMAGRVAATSLFKKGHVQPDANVFVAKVHRALTGAGYKVPVGEDGMVDLSYMADVITGMGDRLTNFEGTVGGNMATLNAQQHAVMARADAGDEKLAYLLNQQQGQQQQMHQMQQLNSRPHYANNNNYRRSFSGNYVRPQRTPIDPKTAICRNCKQIGHFAADCPSNMQGPSNMSVSKR